MHHFANIPPTHPHHAHPILDEGPMALADDTPDHGFMHDARPTDIAVDDERLEFREDDLGDDEDDQGHTDFDQDETTLGQPQGFDDGPPDIDTEPRWLTPHEREGESMQQHLGPPMPLARLNPRQSPRHIPRRYTPSNRLLARRAQGGFSGQSWGQSPLRSCMFKTKSDIAKGLRKDMITLLSGCLADAIDLQTQCKQAHWNVKGPQFIALHKLFDDINESVEEYVDLLAERIAQLGSHVEGTARVAAERSRLPEYPLDIASGEQHLDALGTALAAFNAPVRQGIDHAAEAGDQVTADTLTEIARGVDQWLWFVEAHLQAR